MLPLRCSVAPYANSFSGFGIIPNPQKQWLWTITVILMRKAPTPTVGNARQPVRRPKDLYRKRAGLLRPKA
jgi:hypothetical protein